MRARLHSVALGLAALCTSCRETRPVSPALRENVASVHAERPETRPVSAAPRENVASVHPETQRDAGDDASSRNAGPDSALSEIIGPAEGLMSFGPSVAPAFSASRPRRPDDYGVVVTIGKVEGPVSSSNIGEVFDTHAGAIRACYYSGPEERGIVTVSFRVDPQGATAAAKVTERTLGSTHNEGCLLRQLARWHFPSGGGETIVDAVSISFSSPP